MQARKTRLLVATKGGNLREFREALEAFKAENGERAAALNSSDSPDDPTPFQGAASFGHTSIVSWMLSDSGGRAAGFTGVLARFSSEFSAAHLAIQNGHLGCLKAIIEGCKVENGERDKMLNWVNPRDGGTLLMLAAVEKYEPIIRWLLSDAPGGGRTLGYKNILNKTKQGETALHISAKSGHLGCFRAIVEGCKVDGERAKMLNTLGHGDISVLDIASGKAHESLITWLLSDSGGRAAGFNRLFPLASDGQTCLHMAMVLGKEECFHAIVNGYKVENGERAKLLNACSLMGGTVLNLAGATSLTKVVNWLLSDSGGRASGFNNIFSKSADGRTALHSAAEYGHLPTFHAIVKGCKVENGEQAKLLNTLDLKGTSVLHIAAATGKDLIVKWLLSDTGGRACGFNKILTKLKGQCTAVHIATQENKLNCLQAIINGCKEENGERDEMINSLDTEGRTILHMSCINRLDGIAAWMLSPTGGRAAGFNKVLATTRNGETALYFAIAQASVPCIRAVLNGCQQGGDKDELLEMLNIRNKAGKTSLELLKSHGFMHILDQVLANSSRGGAGSSSSTSTSSNSNAGKAATGGAAAGAGGPTSSASAAAAAAAAAAISAAAAKVKDDGTALRNAARDGRLSVVKKLVNGYKVENGERAMMLNMNEDSAGTILLYAAAAGQEAVVKWILSDSGGRAAGFNNILGQSENGMTALHGAAQSKDLATFKAVLLGSKIENGERTKLLRTRMENGMTVLDAAAGFGCDSIITWLLAEDGGRAAGFVKFPSAVDGANAFHIAAAHGRLSCMTALVKGCKNREELAMLINALERHNMTILHAAAMSDQPRIVEWILSDSGGRKAGFYDVLGLDSNGRMALHLAVEKGSVGCIEAIVEGSKVENGEREAILSNLDVVLQLASLHGRGSVISWLLSNPPGRSAEFKKAIAAIDRNTAFLTAALSGHLACIQSLVKGCKAEDGELEKMVNAVSENGCTALHDAAARGHEAIIKWLLSAKGGRAAGFKSDNISRLSSDSKSALHLAVARGSVECVHTLLSGCSPREKLNLLLAEEKQYGWTALHIAARHGFAEVIRELLLNHEETKAIVDARDRRGMTALHRAVLDGGVDHASKSEWKTGVETQGNAATRRFNVIEALLTAPDVEEGEEETDEQKRQARLDVNLGVK